MPTTLEQQLSTLETDFGPAFAADAAKALEEDPTLPPLGMLMAGDKAAFDRERAKRLLGQS